MQYIFTVTAGRSGQNSLTHLLSDHVPDAYIAFEEPNPQLYLKRFSGILGNLEGRFRRKFIETDELLGRGKVLQAFDEGDELYLDSIVKKRLQSIHRRGVGIYIDISKYFARGLHRAFARTVKEFSLVLLVQDPLLNMKSFLNRNKDFLLDNNKPDLKSNLLVLNSADMAKGELYLWAWCEMYLRYLWLIEEFGVQRYCIIRTEDLNDAEKMDAHLDTLNLNHSPCKPAKRINRNAVETRVGEEDILTFERFLTRLPDAIIQRIAYLDGYVPRGIHGVRN